MKRFSHPRLSLPDGKRLWRSLCWAYKQFAILLFVVFVCFYVVAFFRQSHAADLPAMPTDAELNKAMQRQHATSGEIMDQAGARLRAYQAHPAPLRLPPAADRQAEDPLAVAQRFRTSDEALRAQQQKNDLLAFVSFSMPPASLKRLAREAALTGAVLVFRGLKDNSLKATVTAFKPYAQLGAKAQIDPAAFERYHVTAVPHYVINAGDQPGCPTQAAVCTRQAIELGGDVSLDYALERMSASHHALSDRADQFLSKLRPAP